MTRSISLGLALLALAGCVTTGKYQKEVTRADEATKKAHDTQTKLDAALKTIDQQKADIEAKKKQIAADKAAEADLQSKIKADDDKIASVEQSNKDLTQSLEAKRSSLARKVAKLVEDRDALTQQLADAKKLLATTEAERDALQKEKEAEIAKMKASYDNLTAGLKAEIANGQVQITQLKGQLTLKMVDKILFASGEAAIMSQGKSVLDSVGAALKNIQDKDIRIEGHTDNVPIRGELTKKFPTNWELSTARATAVVRYLIDHDGLDPKRLSVAGYADTRPVAPNDTPESRALNRRIEIVLVPRDAPPAPTGSSQTASAASAPVNQ